MLTALITLFAQWRGTQFDRPTDTDAISSDDRRTDDWGHSGTEPHQERRAVLFVDICDSTALYDLCGDHGAFASISSCIDRLVLHAGKASGIVVKQTGDGLLITFADVAGAVNAAAEMNSDPALGELRLRIGIHAGLVLVRDGDVFGMTVNIAARLMALAAQDQVLITGEAAAELPEALHSQVRFAFRTRVRGTRQRIPVYELRCPSGCRPTKRSVSRMLGEPFYGVEALS